MADLDSLTESVKLIAASVSELCSPCQFALFALRTPSIARADAEPACQPIAPDVAAGLTIVPQPPAGRRHAAHDPLRHDDEGHHPEQAEPQCGPPTVAGLFQFLPQRRPQHDHAEERYGRDA